MGRIFEIPKGRGLTHHSPPPGFNHDSSDPSHWTEHRLQSNQSVQKYSKVYLKVHLEVL